MDQLTPTIVYTVGHSNCSTEQLLRLLQHESIETVVDIRAYPQSKRHPQFAQDLLRENIEQEGMVYHWAGRQLGGMRKSSNGSFKKSRHIALQSESFRAFADYTETIPFKKAVTQLINMAGKSKVVLLCAERLPTECHRSLISDYLLLNGVTVVHIVGFAKLCEHQLSTCARRESLELVYDRAVTGQLDF